jgi:hypothetical protein
MPGVGLSVRIVFFFFFFFGELLGDELAGVVRVEVSESAHGQVSVSRI